MSPVSVLQVLRVGTTSAASPSCDPAIDVARTTPAAFTRYERERTDETRAGIVLRDGVRPVLFEVRPLTAAQWRLAQDSTGERRYQLAFQCACHAFTDETGARHVATVETTGRLTIATDEWLDTVHDRYGAAAIREVGSVALQRAEAGPRALAPFALPRGLMLPR